MNDAKKKKEKGRDPEILKDENGNEYIVSKNGEKIVVQKDKNGRPFYKDSNGNVVMVNSKD